MGKMAWLCEVFSDTRTLHLSVNNSEWRSYTRFPQHAVPDHKIEDGSKGWATYQKLRLAGWELIDTEVAEATRKPVTVDGNTNKQDRE